MSLLGAYLARVPPGSTRDESWWQKARRLPGALFFFGDYDIHQLVLVADTLPLPAPDALLDLAPDHQMVLLSPLPEEAGHDLLKEWPALCERRRLCAYVEVKLQPIFFRLGTGLTSLAVARFLQRQRPVDPRGDSSGVDLHSFLGLSGPDLVFYVFSNDIEAIGREVAAIRSQTFGALRRWLETEDAKEADVCKTGERLKAALEEAVRRGDLDEHRHVCQSVYYLYGLLPRPDGTVYDVERFVADIEDRPTRFRVQIFISTFPGHDADQALRNSLNAGKIAASLPGSRTLSAPSTFSTVGLFDLVHQVVPPGEEGGHLTQREVFRRTLHLLTSLWLDFGPTCQSPHSPGIYRTITVLCLPDAAELVEIAPHAVRTDAEPVNATPTLPEGVGPLGPMVRGLLHVYNTSATNHMTSSYVADLKPFLERLVLELVEQYGKLNQRDDPAAAKRSLDRSFNDLCARVEAALVNRTHGTTRSLRAELLPRPATSLQRLLGVYAALCRSIAATLSTLMDEVLQPEILYCLGGALSARSLWFFGEEDTCPALVVLETAAADILQPEKVVFPLAHELMHVLPLATLKEPLIDPVLERVAATIAGCASDSRFPDLPHASEVELAASIKRALKEDLKDAVDNREKRPDLAVRSMILGIGRSTPYLLSLLYRDATGERVIAQPTATVAEIDDLRERVAAALSESWHRGKEVTADVMAAFATSPDAYYETLPDTEQERREEVRKVIARAKGEVVDGSDAFIEALADIGRRIAATVAQHRPVDIVQESDGREGPGSQERFFRELSGALARERGVMGVLMLLSRYGKQPGTESNQRP